MSLGKNNRQPTTMEQRSNRISKRKRKKKLLLPPSNITHTTKDRLRLSSRPSSDSRGNKNDVLEGSAMIQSPEELAKRLHSGLDIAREAMREGYSSLRNPSLASAGENHLLSARQGSGSISKATEPSPSKGLVMDVNWWFWNLLLAASPSVAVALYCEFVAKPEMKILNEERRKQESSREEHKASASFDDGIGEMEQSNNKLKNMSQMRKRQEEKKREKKEEDESGFRNSHSPLSKSSGGLTEMFSSFVRLLASGFTEEQSPSSKENLGRNGRKEEEEQSSAETELDANEEEHKTGIKETETQDQSLKELQSQLRILKEKIDRHQQQFADTTNGYRGCDEIPDESPTRESLLSPIWKRLPFSSWWQSRRHHQQSSDQCSFHGDGNDISNEKPVTKYQSEKIETSPKQVQKAPTK
eukprot:CAMPEP_0197177350 /NCGR_PEP_ID=MMETSP1423-20130617/2983_1 /TAXON_ID=476441 /ORGANISM="Pseudo-nitzschia heimii, Strain UNC1101" /LENGTH=413 /DNA_ID=CAMNT_0042626883 /DNA_START=28 /DNA_END=1272 /DNA_ORIENTATION=+